MHIRGFIQTKDALRNALGLLLIIIIIIIIIIMFF